MNQPVVFDDWMNDSDAIMWHIERDPLLRSTITSVWILDDEPDDGRLDETMARALTLIPRLRQRVVADPVGLSTPRWEDDPSFDPDHHVRRIDLPPDTDIFSLAAELASDGFDRDRPLWELHRVNGLADGKTAVVMKVHHAVADGMGMVQMTEALIEHSRDPVAPVEDEPAPTAPQPAEPPAGSLDHLGRAFGHRVRADLDMAGRFGRAALGQARHFASHPAQATHAFFDTTTSVGRMVMPASKPRSPLLTERSLHSSFAPISIAFDDLKRVAKAHEVTLNDVFVAAVLGGLGRYHEHHGCAAARLRMNMPISMRADDDSEAGNKFVPARFDVPLDIHDPVKRITALHELLAGTQCEPALPLLDDVSAAINRLGISATTRLLGGMLKSVDITTSNVPGPWFPVYAAGARLEHMYPFGPLAGAAVNVTLFSYDGSLDIGVNADRGAVPDLDTLHHHLDEGFAEILAC